MLEKCPDLNRYCAEGGAEGAGDGAPMALPEPRLKALPMPTGLFLLRPTMD